MKSKLIILILMIFCACTSQRPEKTSGTGDIIKLGKKESLSKVALIFDQSKELKIYEFSMKAETGKSHYYVFHINGKKNRQSKRLSCESKCIYDKFSYNWINDTTLNIKVFSNSSDCLATFKYRIENEGCTFGFDTVSPSGTVLHISIFSQK